MIDLYYYVILSMALFAIGIVGVAFTRHFLIMILSLEVALVAATLASVAFFYFNTNGNIVLLLFTIWTIAAVEAIALISFYRYIARFETTLDVTKLSRLRDE